MFDTPTAWYIRTHKSNSFHTFFYKDIRCNELDRKIITKYRLGCHKLKIQSGRLRGDEKAARLCDCQTIQTISYVLFDCPLTATLLQTNRIENNNLHSFFSGDDYTRFATILKATENMLRIS